MPTRIGVIDSHTGGEPTRVVVSGGPSLGDGPLHERLALFRERYDHFRSAITNEPRASEATVGALLCEATDRSCTTGVIFFNNVGYLGMCGHGLIGLATTLAYMGRIGPGKHRFETPVGIVEATLHEDGPVTVANVPSYRFRSDVGVEVPGFGVVTGDIAWGGNWFFLTYDCPFPLVLGSISELTEYAWAIRRSLKENGITGKEEAAIDHIELFGAGTLPGANSKNFVLCPGKSYDRSPCGTGTSAKMACLYSRGELGEKQPWVQQSITDSLFEGSVTMRDGLIYPSIKGTAFVNAEASLIFDQRDPLVWGIRGPGEQPITEFTGP